MNVLVIPEDPRNDQYVLKPLFERLLQSAGKPRARVRVCQERLGGVDEALKLDRLRDIVEQYDGMTDAFVLCVDRDGDEGRRARLDAIEAELGKDGRAFLAGEAWEEVETWVLAGLDLPQDWRWQEVRAEAQVKERYFEPLARERGVAGGPGGGRKALGEKAARRISAIRGKCPEDFDALARRVEAA